MHPGLVRGTIGRTCPAKLEVPNLQPDAKYLTEKLVALCNIPSPTGFAQAAVEWVENELNALGVETSLTNKGALVAVLPGAGNAAPRALAAHVDTLGAMVREIKPSGRLRLTAIGGYDWSTVEGEYCTIHTASGKIYTGTVVTTKASAHVFGQELRDLKRTDETIEVRLDARVTKADETRELGINVGDYVCFDPRATATESGFIKSRHIDNKAGAVILLELARLYKAGALKPAATTYLFFSNYEEVGHGAAFGIPADARELVAIDMAAVGGTLQSDEYSVTICMKDSSGPYDYELTRRLQRLAQQGQIPHKMDIYPYYSSDASAALRAGAGFRTALIGPGVDASHSFERTHIDALVATTNLLVAYLQEA
jgi:putative aminopeptidase FrvX